MVIQYYCKRLFQSTLPYGSDYIKLIFTGNSRFFQSTLPYGSDHTVIAAFDSCVNFFNPRSLTGATLC